MVNRYIEKALNLVSVQVHGYNPVYSGGAKQVGNKF